MTHDYASPSWPLPSTEPRLKITSSFGCDAVPINRSSIVPCNFYFFLQIKKTEQNKTWSPFFAPTQHRLCRHLEAAEFGHRAAEGRDRHRAQEHAGADGFPSAHQPGHRENRVPAGLLQSHRVLWVISLIFIFCLPPPHTTHPFLPPTPLIPLLWRLYIVFTVADSDLQTTREGSLHTVEGNISQVMR